MKKTTRSILSELQNFVPQENKDIIIESRASHIIQSAINLFEQIEKNYTPEEADELQKKFYSAIKNKDSRRFERAIKKLKENKE